MSLEPVHFCMQCGAPLERRFLFGLERPSCPVCGWIYFEDPKVAAAALVELDGKVLLTRRVNEPHRGEWSLPAGFVDAHEDPASAAERECLEETGLVVRVTHLLDVIAGREHERGADIVILYAVEIIGGDLHAGDDADQVAYFSRDALPPLAFEATRRALQIC
jgi:8-oxo-dGTP diphosphatase